MRYKTPHKTYMLLLVVSLIITGCTFLAKEKTLNAIIASLGAGGIASVCVAWLLDIRNTKLLTIDSKRKTEEIMNQFVRIYRRLMWDVANECYGFRNKGESKSFRAWLSFLLSIENDCPTEGQQSMKTRCNRISSNIVLLQRQIEIFRSQSATLIFEGFPKIEQALSDLELIWVHCCGTIKLLEAEDYKAFCDTTFILYTDFICAFSQYRDRFPDSYSVNSLHP